MVVRQWPWDHLCYPSKHISNNLLLKYQLLCGKPGWTKVTEFTETVPPVTVIFQLFKGAFEVKVDYHDMNFRQWTSLLWMAKKSQPSPKEGPVLPQSFQWYLSLWPNGLLGTCGVYMWCVIAKITVHWSVKEKWQQNSDQKIKKKHSLRSPKFFPLVWVQKWHI